MCKDLKGTVKVLCEDQGEFQTFQQRTFLDNEGILVSPKYLKMQLEGEFGFRDKVTHRSQESNMKVKRQSLPSPQTSI